MTFTLTVQMETAPCSTDPAGVGHSYMGLTLFPVLTSDDPAGDEADYADVRDAMLKPWKWLCTWSGASPVNTIGHVADCPPLDALLTAIDWERRHLLTLDMSATGAQMDDEEMATEDEEDPRWPGVLIQLSRAAPQISHGLGLAYLFSFGEDEPALPNLDSIEIGGTRFTSDQTGDLHVDGRTIRVKVIIERDTDIPVAELKSWKEPINGITRLVKYPADWQTKNNWLAQLAVRLGRALDPVGRFLDMHDDHAPAPLTRDNLESAVMSLLAGLTDETLVRACQSGAVFFNLKSEEMKFADEWASRLAVMHDGLAKAIVLEISGPASSSLPTAGEIRERYEADGLLSMFAATMRSVLPPPKPETKAIFDLASNWLNNSENILALRDSGMCTAIATHKGGLLEVIVTECAAAGDDRKQAMDAFRKNFGPQVQAALGLDAAWLPRLNTMAEGLVKSVFDAAPGVDRVAETGIVHMADAIFADEAAGQIHEIVDGYCLAVRDISKGDQGPFILANKASVTLQKGQDGVSLPFGDCTVPIPVSFDLTVDVAGKETRQAIAHYRGESMIPFADRGNPVEQDEAEPFEPQFTFLCQPPAGSGDALPEIAYGRTYQTVIGYQGLGGAMPAAFCDPEQPLVFSGEMLAQFAAAQGVERTIIKQNTPLRTLEPGAPRLLNHRADMQDRPLTLGRREDKLVRPLWKEYLSHCPDQAAQDLAREAATVFLDPLALPGREAERSSVSFTIAPASLALGQQGTQGYVSDPLVWQYWVRRDGDFTASLMEERPQSEEVDDPAVVSGVAGAASGNGGVVVRLWAIKPDRISKSARLEIADTKHIALAAGERIEATSTSSVDPATVADLSVVGKKLAITLPAGQQFLVEIRTVVDSGFFEEGVDRRFGDLGRAIAGKPYREFGAAVLAFECLPATDDMPTPEAVWKAMRIEDANGVTIARLSPEMDDETFDYVGRIETVRQAWIWDGGPVLPDGLPRNFTKLEEVGPRPNAARSKDFVEFEEDYFSGRGLSGLAEPPVQHSAFAQDELFALGQRSDRGAGYMRIRCRLTSRYDALRRPLGFTEAQLQVSSRLSSAATNGAQSTGDPLGGWRGRGLACRGAARLPTPRIAVAAPMFSTAAPGAASGGILLFLDHPMFDTDHGGGLAERLVAEICIEQIPRRLVRVGDQDLAEPGETAALMVGMDGVSSDGDGNPFTAPDTGDAVHRSRIATRDPGSESWDGHDPQLWTPGGTSQGTARLPCSAILGSTLEPGASAPIMNFSMALLDPVIGGKPEYALRPGTMARIRVRTELDPALVEDGSGERVSPWSAEIWVQMRAMVPGSQDSGEWTREADSGEIRLTPKDTAAHAYFKHLQEVHRDHAPDDNAPYLISGLVAVVGTIIRDINGEEQLRPLHVREVDVDDEELTVLDAGDVSDNCFIRLLEVERVTMPASAEAARQNTPRRWIDPAQPDLEPAERIVTIGPLFRVKVPPA
ncbi:hypothetical protein GCM10009127_13090 [Alteraurantiacibacter aestuarii]|uniref:Uncharacterized protein n=1 Tax=Alteraurantiacibacter aestuarii TaxID=650004 RepID=A0A844ZLC9_9SPHN|nr:hypothetical protein [Alteraurantiacibacter aestuarii]MXO88102.1 hypothetical protein [Alteraurantiacibacter aestuarii]